MKIEFEWDEYLEEDRSWSCLYVRFDEGSWIIAKNYFGTEHVGDILKRLEEDYPNTEFDITLP